MQEFSRDQLEDLYRMVKSPAWSLYHKIMDNALKGDTIDTVDTIEELYKAKGNLEMVNYSKLLETWLEEALGDL